MPSKNKNEKTAEGICFTCKNESGCILSSNKKDAVWECEEYENIPLSPAKNTIEVAPGHDTALLKAQSAESAEYKGLCMDCENRATCMYEKTDGGIWHCENYQ